jgi:hypothetical protein
MSLDYSLNFLIRASTLVHVNSPIGRPMLCHIGFSMMWRRESKERERGRWLKQLPHETTPQPLYVLLLPCNS